jgi:hypothetical protein
LSIISTVPLTRGRLVAGNGVRAIRLIQTWHDRCMYALVHEVFANMLSGAK